MQSVKGVKAISSIIRQKEVIGKHKSKVKPLSFRRAVNLFDHSINRWFSPNKWAMHYGPEAVAL